MRSTTRPAPSSTTNPSNETQIYIQLWDEDKGDAGQGDYIDGDYVRYERSLGHRLPGPDPCPPASHSTRDAAKTLAERTSELGTSR